MNRISSFLALSAIVVAGAFAGTAAQASATNVNVNFKAHNGDGSASMIRGATSSNISGLTSPIAAILPGNDDPATGFALFSGAPLLHINDFVAGSVVYVNASDQFSNKCTFNMKVTRVGQSLYKLHFWITESPTNCSVPPTDATNSDGQFTGTTYALTWKV